MLPLVYNIINYYSECITGLCILDHISLVPRPRGPTKTVNEAKHIYFRETWHVSTM